MEIVWESKLDDIYECKVERRSKYVGFLTIKNQDTVLLEREVGLAYGAMFGPDVADVAQWQEMAIEAVDNQS